jgi:UDP-2,3-diacylglucosamine hydrolase
MAMPAVAELDAPAHWQAVEFISDLHLGPTTPRTFDAWARYLRDTRADAVYMLGDVFEVWVGDDAADEPGSFERQCTEVLREAAARRTVGFMAGNRDFLLGTPLLGRLGLQALPDPLLLRAFGQSLLVTHGDLLCTADTAYQGFRKQVRSTAWQSAFLARPLAERRALAQQMRDASRDAQRQLPPSMWSDVDDAEASRWLMQVESPALLHGHTHKPAVHPLAQGQRYVLSDWDFESPEARGDLIRWTRDGLSRHTMAAGTP